MDVAFSKSCAQFCCWHESQIVVKVPTFGCDPLLMWLPSLRGRQGHSASATTRGRTPERCAPQALLAAGLAAWAPSASAAAGGTSVTVWWPQPITPHDGGREGSPSQGKAAASSARHLSARAERLRHSSGVTGVQWSPGGSLAHTSPQVLLSPTVPRGGRLPTPRLSIAVCGPPHA